MKLPLPAARILLLVALLGQSPAGNAQEGVQEAQGRLRTANLAYTAGEYGDYVAHLEVALALNPASLRTRYELACGYALLGQNKRSLRLLEQLVVLGVDYGIAADPDLASLRNESAYQGLLRRLERKVEPVATSRHLVTIDEFGLIPEGIAYDPHSGKTFLGSMRNGAIYVVDADGRRSRFASLDVPGFSVIGLVVDPGRDILWAIGTATEFAIRPEPGAETSETRTPTKPPTKPAPETRKQGHPPTPTPNPAARTGHPPNAQRQSQDRRSPAQASSASTWPPASRPHAFWPTRRSKASTT